MHVDLGNFLIRSRMSSSHSLYLSNRGKASLILFKLSSSGLRFPLRFHFPTHQAYKKPAFPLSAGIEIGYGVEYREKESVRVRNARTLCYWNGY